MIPRIADLLGKAFEAEGFDPALAVIVPSEKPELADMQCNGVRGAAARAKQDPLEAAARIVSRFNDPDFELSVSGPGYINIVFKPALLENMIVEPVMPRSGAEWIVIDFGGPNIAKPMHVGHLRSLVIGDSLQRILKYGGNHVISDIHFGDWGLQMGMLLAYLEGTPLHQITIETLEEAYPIAAARAKTDEGFRLKAQTFTQLLQQGDEELTMRWKHYAAVSLATVKRELSALDIQFTVYKGESDAQSAIPAMIEDFVGLGFAEEDQGALVVRVGDPPLILRKSDGAALYATTDLATMLQRKTEWSPDRIIYVTDERQQLHFKQVFAAAALAGYMPVDRLHHVWFGTVNDKSGKPLKTRAGGVPKLHDLIQEAIERASEKNPESAEIVAMAALKFADLQNNRTSAYNFDLDKFLSFEGKTGPYLLYQAVRIKSILAKAVAPGPIVIDTEQTRQLAFKLVMGFPAAIDRVIQKLSPKELADHVYDLAQTFSKFYANHAIASDPSRVALATLVLNQLETCLDLLGIAVPDKM